MREVLALHQPDDPDTMLSTFDVLADDIGGLLSDALGSIEADTEGLIVTRIAATPVDAGSRDGAPMIVMETHSTDRAV